MGKSIKKIAGIAAPLALSYFAPGIGSALGGSILGTGAVGASTLGNALIGSGIGALTGGGLKGAALGGLTGGIGANLGSLGDSIQGAIRPGVDSALGAGGRSGILGSIGSATGLTNGGVTSALGGLTGAGGGGSTFGLGSIANIAGTYQQDQALKKAQDQLLKSNGQQMANLESFDPSGITSDPNYQFNLEQGQQGLDRALGAGGNLFSGRALKAASEYNQNYANNAFDDYYKRWMTKTNGQNSLYGTEGDILANSGLARSQNYSNLASRF